LRLPIRQQSFVIFIIFRTDILGDGTLATPLLLIPSVASFILAASICIGK
jgi:hypothetical protein